MKIAGAHLTYCTNIHPGESWAEVRANLETHVAAVKQRVCPDAPFGVGLRLSARAARELEPEISALRRWLDDAGMYVFTINGFPHGTFHGIRVKADVYRPDWLEDERVAYTNLLGDLLAELLPDGVAGSISTVPGCFRDRTHDPADLAPRIRASAAHFAAIEERTGKRITLALEPEPCCVIETIAEAITFFTLHLRNVSHVGLCLDTCHAAVEYEELGEALDLLWTANVTIAKIQLSSGLVVPFAARAELQRFADEVYLHQVVARHGDALARYVDLPEALADTAPADEWRVHFHVPLFRAELGVLASTQPFVAEMLRHHRTHPVAPHLEVETYTWDVLPPEFRGEPIDDAIARELAWVIEHLA
jgi:sugar phosphate isomerase/epimerase